MNTGSKKVKIINKLDPAIIRHMEKGGLFILLVVKNNMQQAPPAIKIISKIAKSTSLAS
jgi:hypothetical protein